MSAPKIVGREKAKLAERILFPVHPLNSGRLASQVNGKTILITGASFGIGARLAEILSNYKVTLVLVARTTERLEFLKNNLPVTTHIFSTDLRNESSVNSLLKELIHRGIEVDIVISNAGKSIYRNLMDSLHRFHDIKRSSATNYTGPIQLLLGLLPGIIKRKGHIINVSTVSVLLPHTTGWSAYHSSKGAFDDWLLCIEPELKNQEVSVSHVYLPLVRTRMSMVNQKNDRRAAMTATGAATVILNCLVYKRRKYQPWIVGIPVFLDTLFPNLWYCMQVQRLKKKN